MADRKPRRFRWKTGLAILFLGILATAVAWFYFPGDRTMRVMMLYMIWPATGFVLLLWWMFLSGFRWRTRWFGFSMLVAAVGVGLVVLKFDKFDGAMVPAFVWRWEDPLWPSVVFLAAFAWTFFTRFEWKTRLIGLGCVSAGAAACALFGVPGFQLRADAGEYGAEGPRSKESREFADRLKQRDQLLQHPEFVSAVVGVAPRTAFRVDDEKPRYDNWPNFRGPLRDGVVRDGAIRFDWTDDNRPKNLWRDKQRVGRGWSSFAVVDGLAITQEQRGEKETVVCYDFANGSEIWKHEDDAHFQKRPGGNGPRATPTIAGRRVYTLGATGILNCLDVLTGKKHWQRKILADAGATNIPWGMAGSPLVHDGLVYVNPGEGGNKAVIAYNHLNGEIVWAAGNDPASYCSPVIRRIHGVNQLLIFHGEGLVAYDPKTGKELWNKGGWINQPKVNAAIPIVKGNRILISSGYQLGSALLKVSVNEGRWSVEDVWRNKRFRLKFNDGIYKDGYVYGLDEGILSCVDFETGGLKWRMRTSFGYGQMLLAGDRLVIASEKDGRVSFVKTGPTRPTRITGFQALNRDRGVFDSKGVGWNHPVITRGRLLIRNDLEVACYDLRGK
ncbi:MAG: PQQ-binding-like beta-propeller repeat protein [Planctomycetaceae bacterium]